MLKQLSYNELKRKIPEERKGYLGSLNVVNDTEKAICKSDYCRKKYKTPPTITRRAVSFQCLSAISVKGFLRCFPFIPAPHAPRSSRQSAPRFLPFPVSSLRRTGSPHCLISFPNRCGSVLPVFESDYV